MTTATLPATLSELLPYLGGLALVAGLIAWPHISPWLGEKLDALLFGDEPDLDDEERGGL